MLECRRVRRLSIASAGVSVQTKDRRLALVREHALHEACSWHRSQGDGAQATGRLSQRTREIPRPKMPRVGHRGQRASVHLQVDGLPGRNRAHSSASGRARRFSSALRQAVSIEREISAAAASEHVLGVRFGPARPPHARLVRAPIVCHRQRQKATRQSRSAYASWRRVSSCSGLQCDESDVDASFRRQRHEH